MRLYCGMDLHSTNTVIVIINRTGRAHCGATGRQ